MAKSRYEGAGRIRPVQGLIRANKIMQWPIPEPQLRVSFSILGMLHLEAATPTMWPEEVMVCHCLDWNNACQGERQRQ